jgi:hypothetical protein
MERMRDTRSILEQIGMHIPGFKGYFRQEFRRDADKIQRDYLAQELGRCKTKVEGVKRDFAMQGELEGLTRLESVTDKISRLVTRVTSADYGDSGFFGSTGVTEADLAAVYQLDLALIEQAKALTATADPLSAALPKAEYQTALTALETAVGQFDTQFDQRKNILKGAK